MFQLLFTANRLGGKNDDSSEVTGDYFNRLVWKTICLNKCNVKCDPNDKSKQPPLRRFPNETYYTHPYPGWPLREDIENALNLDSFHDSKPYNKYNKDSFGNFVEGYEPTSSCGERDICNCDMRGGQRFVRKLHNSVSA